MSKTQIQFFEEQFDRLDAAMSRLEAAMAECDKIFSRMEQTAAQAGYAIGQLQTSCTDHPAQGQRTRFAC